MTGDMKGDRGISITNDFYKYFFENVCKMINKRMLLQNEQCVLLPVNPERFITLTAKRCNCEEEEKNMSVL
ncbi:hypothetical protein CEXT_346781 [Caerostris extrusa]|uniref:Uncharacterized protein n=1 Tax=Caerostris extrusa TaxID=172846 RepID=A0AAV4Q7C7_CAEEX|nr:hypothetical protein CEXT_346781 [Caerostris extrusa]